MTPADPWRARALDLVMAAERAYLTPEGGARWPNVYEALAEHVAAALADAAGGGEAVRAALDELAALFQDLSENKRLAEQHAAEAVAQRHKAEGDMYGWNFHMGVAGGMNQADILYCRLGRAIRERLAALPDAGAQGLAAALADAAGEMAALRAVAEAARQMNNVAKGIIRCKDAIDDEERGELWATATALDAALAALPAT